MGAIIYTNGNFQAVDDNGDYVANGTLIFNNFEDGSPATTYRDSLATISNSYEIPLSASGKADVYLIGGEYEIILKNSDGVIVRTIPRFVPFLGNNGGTNYANREQFTATQGQTEYTLGDIPIGTSSVYIDGVLQNSTQYTISANALTFNEALNAGQVIIVDYSTTSSGGGTPTNQTILNERNTVLDYGVIDMATGSNISVLGGKRITQASGFNDNGNVDIIEVLQNEIVDVSTLGALDGTNYLYKRINGVFEVSQTKLAEPNHISMVGTKVLLGTFEYATGVVNSVVASIPTSHLREIEAQKTNTNTLNGRDANIVLTGRIDGTTLYISSNDTAP